MPSAKQVVLEIVTSQPDESTFHEIPRELTYARMVRQGREDSDAGRTVSDEEVRRNILGAYTPGRLSPRNTP